MLGAQDPSFLSAFEAELSRRQLEQRAREERELASRAIDDQVTRDIALFMRQQETQDARRAELERLHGLIQEHARDPGIDLADRARVAFTRALMQGNYSALEALEREVSRQFEEEEHAVLMLLLH